MLGCRMFWSLRKGPMRKSFKQQRFLFKDIAKCSLDIVDLKHYPSPPSSSHRNITKISKSPLTNFFYCIISHNRDNEKGCEGKGSGKRHDGKSRDSFGFMPLATAEKLSRHSPRQIQMHWKWLHQKNRHETDWEHNPGHIQDQDHLS